MKWLIAIGLMLWLPYTPVQAQHEGVIELESRRPDEVLAAQLADSRLLYLMVYHRELIVAVADTALQPLHTIHINREKEMRQATPVSISGVGDSIYIYTYDTREREYGCYVVDLRNESSTFSIIRENSKSEKYFKTISLEEDTYLLTVLEDNNRLLVRKVFGAQVLATQNYIIEIPGFYMKLVEDYSSWSGTGVETYLPEVSLSQRPDLIDELPQFKMYQDGSEIIITDDEEGKLHCQTLDLATGATAFQRYDIALERELRHKDVVGNSSYRDGMIYRLTGSNTQAKLSIIDLEAEEIIAEHSIFRSSYPDEVSPPHQAMLELYKGDQTKRRAKEVDTDAYFEELHRGEPTITVDQTSDTTMTCTLAATRTIGYPVTGMTRQPFTMRIGGVFSPNYIYGPWSPMQSDDMRITYVTLALSGDALVPLSDQQRKTVPQLVAAHERKWHRRTPQSAKTVLCLRNGDVVYGYYSGRKQYTLRTLASEE